MGFLSDLVYRQLCREIGEPLKATQPLPFWDRLASELRYEGKLLRVVSMKGKNIRLIQAVAAGA